MIKHAWRIIDKLTPGKGDEIQLTDAIRMLIADGRKVLGVRLPSSERRFEIGAFDSYFRAFVEFSLADPQCGEELRAHLKKLLDMPQPGQGISVNLRKRHITGPSQEYGA